jgi:hypothetical protein
MIRLLTKWKLAIGGAIAVATLLLAFGCVAAFRSLAHRGLFRTNLNTLERRDDWQAYGGTWQLVNGVMRNNSDERGAKLINGSVYWADYMVQGDVLLLGQYGDSGLIIRASDEEEGVDAYHGYMAGLRDLDNTLILGRAD